MSGYHAPSLAERTAFHLVCVHRNAGAIITPFTSNLLRHAREHKGDGVTQHEWLDETSLHYTPEGVELVLEEAEAQDAEAKP